MSSAVHWRLPKKPVICRPDRRPGGFEESGAGMEKPTKRRGGRLTDVYEEHTAAETGKRREDFDGKARVWPRGRRIPAPSPSFSITAGTARRNTG